MIRLKPDKANILSLSVKNDKYIYRIFLLYTYYYHATYFKPSIKSTAQIVIPEWDYTFKLYTKSIPLMFFKLILLKKLIYSILILLTMN